MKKRTLAVLLAASLVLALAGCGGSGSKQADAPKEEAAAEEAAVEDEAEAAEAEADAAETEEEAVEAEAAAAEESPAADSEAEAETEEEAAADASDLEDVTDLLGTDRLADYMGQKVRFSGLVSVDIEDVGGDLIRFLYNSEGTGDTGDDLYFTMVRQGEETEDVDGYLFVVKADQCGPETETYKTVEELGEEAVVDMVGTISEVDGKTVPVITEITVLDPGIVYE